MIGRDERICRLKITQLKIASNPFAKGFRDCDPEDWWEDGINGIKYLFIRNKFISLFSWIIILLNIILS